MGGGSSGGGTGSRGNRAEGLDVPLVRVDPFVAHEIAFASEPFLAAGVAACEGTDGREVVSLFVDQIEQIHFERFRRTESLKWLRVREEERTGRGRRKRDVVTKSDQDNARKGRPIRRS